MNTTKLLVLFGGESSEHDISVMSARNVYDAVSKEKYDVYLVYIDPQGKWWLLDGWQEDLDNHGGLELATLPGSGTIVALPEMKTIKIDVAFPVMHGENGHEDGAIQGLLRMAHIPFVGSDIGASAICWNKLYTKEILARNHTKVTPYFVYRRGQPLPDYKRLIDESPEMFVKPTTAGSSVGVSKVHGEDEFKPAIDLALKNSDTVLIEQGVVGRELEVAVLGNTQTNYRASGVGEIISGEEFYSYNDKYSEASTAKVITKADISNELKHVLQRTARHAFLVLGCKGLARVDFLVSETGEVYVNELNTMPGFTNISQYPKLWQEEGIGYEELIDELIADAIG